MLRPLEGKCPLERAKEVPKERVLRPLEGKCPLERAKEVPKERVGLWLLLERAKEVRRSRRQAPRQAS